MLHDVGMITIPEEILNAPRKLKDEEINLIHGHVTAVTSILQGKLSDDIIQIAEAHHERFDGSGYPNGLKGKMMGTKEAILQIAEVVVNLSIDKSYRKAFTKEEIITELNNGIVSGVYDGKVADIFLKNYDEIMNLANEKAKSVLITHQKLQMSSEKIQKSFTS